MMYEYIQDLDREKFILARQSVVEWVRICRLPADAYLTLLETWPTKKSRES